MKLLNCGSEFSWWTYNVLLPESERLRVHVTDGNSGPGVKKPPLHVETFSWNLCATALRNKFQQALHRVTWSVSWNFLNFRWETSFTKSRTAFYFCNSSQRSQWWKNQSFTVKHHFLKLVLLGLVTLRCVSQSETGPSRPWFILRPISMFRNKFRRFMLHGATPAETCFGAPLHTSFSWKFQRVMAAFF